MRRIKYVLDGGYAGTEQTEIVEFPDGTLDKEIADDFEIWYMNNKKEEYYAVELDENNNESEDYIETDF